MLSDSDESHCSAIKGLRKQIAKLGDIAGTVKSVLDPRLEMKEKKTASKKQKNLWVGNVVPVPGKMCE